MLTEERWRLILDLLDREKAVTVPELEQALDASPSTIRRDLNQLHKAGKLIKVHGGATSLDSRYMVQELSMAEKKTLHYEEKQAIGRYAAGLISPDDFVYIDSGTTAEALADAITETGAVYMTNSVMIAMKLAVKGCRVFLPEGEMKSRTEAIVGGLAADSIKKYHFTIGFWGTNGVDEKAGFTTPEVNEALVKQVSMRQAAQRYVLCDRSKFSVISPVSFGVFESATIVTDRIPDKKYQKYEHIVEVMK